MNQEQIIKMALDSGMAAFKHSVTVAHVTDLERFAALVAAAEREALAQFFQDHWRETWTDLQIAEAIRARGQA